MGPLRRPAARPGPDARQATAAAAGVGRTSSRTTPARFVSGNAACATMGATVSRPGGRGSYRQGATPPVGNELRKVGTPQGRVLVNGQSG